MTVRDVLEGAYFVFGGPVLAAVAFCALRQVNEIRRQTTQSEAQHREVLEREASRLAVDLCEQFLREVAPAARELHVKLNRAHQTWFEAWSSGPYFEWSAIPLAGTERKRLHARLTAVVDPNHGADIFNMLEAAALLFNRGLASDETGQALLRDALVVMVEDLWPLIALVRSGSPQAYGELIALYERWAQRAREDSGSCLTKAST